MPAALRSLIDEPVNVVIGVVSAHGGRTLIPVLYVDDESDLLDVGRLFLEQDGQFRVDTSTSAKKALEFLQSRHYDAIIADYMMKDMDGIAFLKAVRELAGDIPFILFTGRGREEVVIDAINNGADFYLQKGGDPEAQFAELIHKIEKAIERRQALSALRNSEQRLADIINFLPDATFAINTSGIVIAWNRAMEEMTGTPAADILGKGEYEYAIPFYGTRRPILIDLVLAPDERFEKDRYLYASRDGTTLTAETVLQKPDGSRVHLWGKASRLYDKNGNLTGAIESIRDVTDLRQAEEAIRESEGRFRAIVETSPDMIWEIDMQGVFRYISPRITKILGYCPEELVGQPVTTLLAEEARQYIMEKIARDGASKGSLFTFEVPARHKDGRDLVIEIRSSLFTDSDRNVTRFRGVARDVTDKKKADEAVRQAHRKLTLMTGIIRHDILNNIMVILGFMRQAKKGSPGPEMTAFIEKLERRTKQIRNQIEFTRVYEKLGTHDPQLQDIHTVISHLQIPLGIILTDTCAGIEILSDVMLEKVFENLLDNSMRHGEHVTEIRISAQEAGPGLIITYEDNGLGIPTDEKEKIFERGFGKNTGFGLFLVREILALTGIMIRETGEPDRGARFEMTIPKGSYRIRESE